MKNNFLISPNQLNLVSELDDAMGGGMSNSQITRRTFIKRTGGATVATLVAWNLTQSRARAEQESRSCSFIGVIGTPAGENYTDIQTIAGGDISAKVQIKSSPVVGYGNSVTVMARVEIWITNDYAQSVEHSAWVDVTGWINSTNCFESGTNTGSGNFVGACPRTGSNNYMGYINVKALTSTTTQITADLEFSLQSSIPVSPPGGMPNPGSPFTLSVEAV